MPQFSKGQKRIAAYILEHYDKAAFMTASRLGQMVEVSESTVVRFAAQLGYEGYPEMQRDLRELIRGKLTSIQRIQVSNDQMQGDLLTSVMQRDMDSLRTAIEQVDRAVAAGAKFIVSPGFDPEIVDYCMEKNIPVFPGCVSPSEVAQAVKRGLKVVKFFPAEQAGGLAMLKAMAAPYTMLKFMPTGGINTKNLKEYLGFSKILCCGGSWMVKGDMIKNKEFDKITEMTREATELAAAARRS